jgi:hypothetical protein
MRKTLPFVALVALLTLIAAPVLAQQKAPTPAGGPAAEALAAWNSIGRKLITMAEDFPENKYDFKPKPEVRTFAEQLLHVAGTNYVLLSAVKGSQIGPGTEDPPRSTYKTKADVVALLKKSVEDGASLIKERGDVGMPKSVKFPYGNRMVSANLIFMDGAEHSGEHYGQLVVYYRLNGIVPPASRPQQ